jgi:hypothetical protein
MTFQDYISGMGMTIEQFEITIVFFILIVIASLWGISRRNEPEVKRRYEMPEHKRRM